MKQIPVKGGHHALVSNCDYKALASHKWHLLHGYVARRPYRDGVKQDYVYMHHEVMRLRGKEITDEVDHKNCNRLDNRYCNLRLATHGQNMLNKRRYSRNTSGFIGVSWEKLCQKWRAQICLRGKRIHLGLFTDKKAAAIARDVAAIKYFGEFARLNFPNFYPGAKTNARNFH